MPSAPAPDPKHTNDTPSNQLGKRDHTVVVQRDESWYYCVYVVTSSSSAYKLIVDSGSAYTWVGGSLNNPYVEGVNSLATGVPSKAAYGGGLIKFKGETYEDTIALDNLVINHQGIGVPTEVTGLPEGIDGMLGLGPTRLTTGISSDGMLIPTVVDNLYSERTIPSPLLGVYFMPTNMGGSGLLSFGQIDVTVLTSDVKYVPVTTLQPASYYWSIEATIVYGANTPILDYGSGMLDTGSPSITISSDAGFFTYALATGGIIHSPSRITITQNQYNNLQTLYFFIGDQYYHLSPNAQIYPRSSPNGQIWLAVHLSDPKFPLDFCLGIPFIQRYYVVFDSGSNQIGFASHIYTDSITN
ncbi:hypothetical protein ID866_8602 [Astraeus odoratus]|nr:hypothetical protein ID866_8602 [Astraeus odoratus]